MADITTDVLIIGTGLAGSATAALPAACGAETMIVNRDRWLAGTPRGAVREVITPRLLTKFARSP